MLSLAQLISGESRTLVDHLHANLHHSRDMLVRLEAGVLDRGAENIGGS